MSICPHFYTISSTTIRTGDDDGRVLGRCRTTEIQGNNKIMIYGEGDKRRSRGGWQWAQEEGTGICTETILYLQNIGRHAQSGYVYIYISTLAVCSTCTFKF